MQVQPIAAIRPTKIRPRPISEIPGAHERDTSPQPQFVPTTRDVAPPQEPAPAEFSPANYSAYTAQLLITHQTTAETKLDRNAQINSYSAGSRAAPDAPQFSMSV